MMILPKLKPKKGLNKYQKEMMDKHPRPIVPIRYTKRLNIKSSKGVERIEKYDIVASTKIMCDLIDKYTKLNENKYKTLKH